MSEHYQLICPRCLVPTARAFNPDGRLLCLCCYEPYNWGGENDPFVKQMLTLVEKLKRRSRELCENEIRYRKMRFPNLSVMCGTQHQTIDECITEIEKHLTVVANLLE